MCLRCLPWQPPPYLKDAEARDASGAELLEQVEQLRLDNEGLQAAKAPLEDRMAQLEQEVSDHMGMVTGQGVRYAVGAKSAPMLYNVS